MLSILSVWTARIFILFSYTFYSELFWSIAQFFGACFWCTLLSTLVTRLHLTFKGTALELTRDLVLIFIFIFVSLCISIMVGWVSGILHLNANDDDENVAKILFFYTLWSFLILYTAGSALSVRLFVTKLTDVAKAVGSTTDLTKCGGDVMLSSKQLTLFYLSAKYILLFFVAISTSFLLITLWISRIKVKESDETGTLLASVDFCVNLICLRFQFAFAEKEYQKCCGYLDSCCRKMVLNRGKRKMRKELLRKRVKVNDVSPENSKSEIEL